MLTAELNNSLQEIAQNLGLESVQGKALQEFISKGFPTSKWEEWKYTSLKDFNGIARNWSPKANFTLSSSLDWADFVLQTSNGYVSWDKSRIQEGFALLSFEEFLQKCPQFESTWSKKNPLLEQNSLFDLNVALNPQHMVLWIKKDTEVTKAILHQYQVAASENASAVQARWLIYLEEGAKATFIEQQSSTGSGDILSNFVQEIFVEKGAQFTYLKEQDFQTGVSHVDHTFIYQAEGSQVDTFTFSLNASLIRNNLHFYIEGPQVVSNLNGLYVPGENQLMDSHTVVDHRMPHSESNELYKGVLMGNATGVFNGKIFVRQDAQKTNAFQSCRNVLASTRATMNTKPQLEIWADDVKCSHGTTTGQLNEEALFYMRSRGISLPAARTLLLLAFVQEVINKVEHPEMRELLTEKIVSKIQQSVDLSN
ncbi:Fe-S cluster assembly protein SufD [Aquirufa sp. Wall-65K1]